MLMICFKKWFWPDKMTQKVKMLAAQADGLRLNPGVHMVKGQS